MKPETCTRILAAQLITMMAWAATAAWLFATAN